MQEPVDYRCDDEIAIVTLNRPARRNAVSSALARGLVDAMAAAASDPDVRVVIVTGADPAFCAGLDLSELADSGQNLAPIPGEGAPWSPGAGPWWPVSKPVIGAVNGPAVTGGLEIALHCDILVASERGTFGDTHVRVGVFPGGGMLVHLPRSIGAQSALAMSLTGNFIDAGEALRLGLVHRVVPHEQLLPTARALAADIAANDPRLVREILEAHRTIVNATVEEGRGVEAAAAARWQLDFEHRSVADRRRDVVARGRAQQSRP